MTQPLRVTDLTSLQSLHRLRVNKHLSQGKIQPYGKSIECPIVINNLDINKRNVAVAIYELIFPILVKHFLTIPHPSLPFPLPLISI